MQGIEKSKKTSSLDKLLLYSSYAIFIVLVATLVFSVLRYFLLSKKPSQNTAVENSQVKNATWVIYRNDEFGYTLEYPLYLYPNEVKETERYLSFITFEETNFSSLDGIAVAITNKSLEEEVNYVKDSFTESGGGELKEVKEGEKFDRKFKLLNFEVKDNVLFQNKSVFVINDGRYTMSISTTPGQVEHVINSLKFF